MRIRGVTRYVLGSLAMAIAASSTAAKAQNPTTPGAIPNPGTYQGSTELQRQSDQRDQQLREEQQRQQQAYPQQRTFRGDEGAARQGGGGPARVPPRVAPDFAANDRALAAVRRKDYAAAIRIARPLADRGDMVAGYLMGALYDRGMGVPENHPMALQYFRRSAGEGYSQSMRNLGTMYRSGEAGPVNYVEAYRWYALSLSHLVPGETDADGIQELKQDLSEVSAKMTGPQIATAKKLARETNIPFLR